MDEDWRIVWDRFKPASFCGAPYQTYFVPSYNINYVDMVYKEPLPPRPVLEPHPAIADGLASGQPHGGH
jgi:hypothetical protein